MREMPEPRRSAHRWHTWTRISWDRCRMTDFPTTGHQCNSANTNSEMCLAATFSTNGCQLSSQQCHYLCIFISTASSHCMQMPQNCPTKRAMLSPSTAWPMLGGLRGRCSRNMPPKKLDHVVAYVMHTDDTRTLSCLVFSWSQENMCSTYRILNFQPQMNRHGAYLWMLENKKTCKSA